MAEKRKARDRTQGASVAIKAAAAEPAQTEARRNYAPRDIAGLLAPVTRPILRKRSPGAAALAEDWAAIVGPELAARSLPVKLAAGTLTIGCVGPEALELQHRTPQLMARINLALGREQVVRLRFVQHGSLEPTPDPAPKRPSKKFTAEPPDNLPEGELGEALAALYRGIMSRR